MKLMVSLIRWRCFFLLIDSGKLEIRPKPERMEKNSKALIPIIRGIPISGHELEIVVGYLVSLMLVSRWSLSFLCYPYRFIQKHWYVKMFHGLRFGENCGVFVESCLVCEVLLFQIPRRTFSVLMLVVRGMRQLERQI